MAGKFTVPNQPEQSPRGNKPRQGEVHRLRTQLEASATTLEQRAKESWQQGFEAGEAAARQKLEGEIRLRFEKLAATIAEVAGLRSETIRRAEADTVRLSIEIARRVLHREIVRRWLRARGSDQSGARKASAQEVYRVRVHPGAGKTRARLPGTGRAAAKPSRSHQRSRAAQGRGLFSKSAAASLDASVETQLREIERGLIDEMETAHDTHCFLSI